MVAGGANARLVAGGTVEDSGTRVRSIIGAPTELPGADVPVGGAAPEGNHTGGCTTGALLLVACTGPVGTAAPPPLPTVNGGAEMIGGMGAGWIEACGAVAPGGKTPLEGLGIMGAAGRIPSAVSPSLNSSRSSR